MGFQQPMYIFLFMAFPRLEQNLKQIRNSLHVSTERFEAFSSAFSDSVGVYSDLNAWVTQIDLPKRTKQAKAERIADHNAQLEELKSVQDRYRYNLHVLLESSGSTPSHEYPIDVVILRDAIDNFQEALGIIISAYGVPRKIKKGAATIPTEFRHFLVEAVALLDIHLDLTPKNKSFKRILCLCLGVVDNSYRDKEQNLPRLLSYLNDEACLLHLEKLYFEALMSERYEVLKQLIIHKNKTISKT